MNISTKMKYFDQTRINDIAIAMSYSSRAYRGLRVAFKCLNVLISVTALAAWLETFKCLNV